MPEEGKKDTVDWVLPGEEEQATHVGEVNAHQGEMLRVIKPAEAGKPAMFELIKWL